MKQESNEWNVIDAFERLLQSKNVYHIYMASFYEQNIDELCVNLYQEWRDWADTIKPEKWIAFVKDTDYNPNRLIDWHSINNEWIAICRDNLND